MPFYANKMSTTAIKVERLTKRYRIGMEEEIHDSLVGQFASFIKSPMSNYKRLKKLSNLYSQNRRILGIN